MNIIDPTISVIIPAYNAEKFIAKAIESVLAQKCRHETEIIVIDDNSTDNTRNIVYSMSKQYGRIILLTNERKKGPSGARNTGLLESRGYYISFLDADDLWYSNHLEEGINFLEKNDDVDAVFYNFDVYEYAAKKKIGDWFSLRNFTNILKTKTLGNEYYLISDDIYDALLNESFIHLQSMIIRHRVINNILFNENVQISEDRDFAIKLYTNSKAHFAYKNLITGVYYRHLDSLTSNNMQKLELSLYDHIYLLKSYLEHEPQNSSKRLKIKKMLFNKYISLSYSQRKLIKHRAALKALIKSFSYGISNSQLLEFAKIVASCILYPLKKKYDFK